MSGGRRASAMAADRANRTDGYDLRTMVTGSAGAWRSR